MRRPPLLAALAAAGVLGFAGAAAFRPVEAAAPQSAPRTWECGMGNRCIDAETQCQANPNLRDGAVIISACKSDQGFRLCWHQGAWYCKGMNAAERAEAERTRRENAAKRAAAAAVERDREARIAALVAKWGPHRAAEARRAVEMEMAAEAARARPLATGSAASPVTAPAPRAAPAPDNRKCMTRPYSKADHFSWWARPVREIQRDYAEVRASAGTICGGTPGTVGALVCPKPPALGYQNCQASLNCPGRETKCSSQGTSQ